jgi:hypothetical protein
MLLSNLLTRSDAELVITGAFDAFGAVACGAEQAVRTRAKAVAVSNLRGEVIISSVT